MKRLPLLLVLMCAPGAFAQSIADLEKAALSAHPRVIQALSEVRVAEAEGKAGVAPFRPMVSLTALSAAGDDNPVIAGSIEPVSYLMAAADPTGMAAVMAMWRIYSGGQDRAAAEAGRAQRALAEANLAAVRLDVLQQVRIAYAEALSAKGADEAAALGVQAAEELLRVTDERFKAGVLPEAFLLKARADLAAAQRAKAVAAAGLADKVAGLKEAAAMPQTQDLTLFDWPEPLGAPESLKQCLEAARSRPEAVAAEARRDEQRARLRYVRRSRSPQVDLFAMGTGMATESESEAFYKVGAVLSFPIADGGMRSAEVVKMEAMAESAGQELRAVRLRIDREVAAAWAAWQAAPQALQASEAEVASAQEAYRIAKVRYEEGKAPQVEVKQAAADLVSAFAGRAESNAFRRTAWANLMRAVGITQDQEDHKKQ